MPELCVTFRPKQRARGMPGARCTRSRACSVESTRVSHHGRTGIPGIPARNGFNGFLRALPGDRACLPPSPVKLLFTNLTPASGRQDHTTSPSARSALVSSAAYVHRIPCPTFVTIAKRPFVWAGMAADREVICAKWEQKYFCEGGWTGKSLDRDFWHQEPGDLILRSGRLAASRRMDPTPGLGPSFETHAMACSSG
jgi:hypothetical protein